MDKNSKNSKYNTNNNTNNNSNNILWIYHIIITGLFVYILVQFLSMQSANPVYRFYTTYLMNTYYLLLYLVLCVIIYQYDKYSAVLMALLIIPPFKIAHKEFFDVPETTTTQPALVDREVLGIDDRFKVDEVVIKDILRQIKSQVDFDPYKTNLDKSVIYEIYNRYFNNDIFTKLKKNNDDSASYIAAGNFKYLPTTPQVDFDITTYQNLSDNIQFGVSPLLDGIGNTTKINRGS